MPIIGSYSPGGPGGSASANEYSTIDELLNQLPDNTANLIDPSDIRDSVYTLWERISDVQTTASQSASFSVYYTNPLPVPTTIGGISAGTTFPGTYSMQEMWDLLLYPYVAPLASLSIPSGTTRQYGAALGVSLSWSATKKSNNINSIVVDGFTVPGSPFTTSQSGTKSTTATHSTTPGLTTAQSYSMTVNDGTSTISATTTLTWMNRRYWGYINLTSLGTIDLTLFPLMAPVVGAYITSTMIKTMNNAGVSPGSELASTIGRTYTNINGSGYHLVFAFPTAFGTPSWTVAGLPNSAFTKVKSNFAFVNDYGFSGTNYDVWITNTAQNSPLTIVIS